MPQRRKRHKRHHPPRILHPMNLRLGIDFSVSVLVGLVLFLGVLIVPRTGLPRFRRRFVVDYSVLMVNYVFARAGGSRFDVFAGCRIVSLIDVGKIDCVVLTIVCCPVLACP